jgi:hypothetical protein
MQVGAINIEGSDTLEILCTSVKKLNQEPVVFRWKYKVEEEKIENVKLST